MSRPSVSVLMTAFNRASLISPSIESVIASYYKDFELVIVDDASSDNTYEVALSYAKNDDRIRVFRNDKNLGDYPNRNKAARLANGKYLKYIDSDDIIYPHGLGVFVECMDKFPNAAWGVSLPNDTIGPFPRLLSPREAYIYHYFKSGLFKYSPLEAIIRKDAFVSVNGFKEERMVSDFEFWNRITQNHNVLLLPNGLTWYRNHDNQEITDRDKYHLRYLQTEIKYLYDEGSPIKDIANRCMKDKVPYFIKRALYYLLKRKQKLCINDVRLATYSIGHLLGNRINNY